jgi:hypothetical protein
VEKVNTYRGRGSRTPLTSGAGTTDGKGRRKIMALNKSKLLLSIILLAGVVILFFFTAFSCKHEYSMRLLQDGRVYFKRGTIEGVIVNNKNIIKENDFEAVKDKLDVIESVLVEFVFGSLSDRLWKDYEDELRMNKSTTEDQIEYNLGARWYFQEHWEFYKRQYSCFTISSVSGSDSICVSFLPAMENWMDVKGMLVEDGGPSFWEIYIDLPEKKVAWFNVHGMG